MRGNLKNKKAYVAPAGRHARAGPEDFGARGGRKFGTLYIYKKFMRLANTLR